MLSVRQYLLISTIFPCMVGCVETRTGFDVSVVVDPAIRVQQLVYVAKAAGRSTDPILTSDREGVLLVVPDDWAGHQAQITVDGIAGGQVVKRGMETAEVREGELRGVVVLLQDGGCTTSCQEGTTQCVGDGTRRCERDGTDCTRWSVVAPCPAEKPHCSQGICASSCQDECQPGLRRCTAAGQLQVCGQHDSDDCHDWSTPLSCNGAERCVSGQCVLLCDGKPCACQAGETQPCANVGQCRGGKRHCANGQFGLCQWTVGPQAEVCDGKDNDCNGAVDDALSAPICAKQRGVCAGAVQTCGGHGGWLACTVSDYQRKNAAYQAVETRCDGKDNDCDGEKDEASECCEPSCVGKACGADDGCGGSCHTGSCGPNASCKYGKCACSHEVCLVGCCAANEQCNGLFCVCQPDCAGKRCGDPDGCNGQCKTGSCPGSAICLKGQCCTPNCAGKACGASDGCGSSCQNGPCAGAQDVCQGGKCVCQPACSGKDCLADDGCGGSCVTSDCPTACSPPCRGNAACVANVCVAEAAYMSDCTKTGCHALPCDTGYRQVPRCYVEYVGATTPLCLKTEIKEYWTVRDSKSCPPTTHEAWRTPWGTDCSSGPAPSGGYIYFDKLCLRD